MDFDCAAPNTINCRISEYRVVIDRDADPELWSVTVLATSTEIGNGLPPARFEATDEDYCTAAQAAYDAAEDYYEAP